MRKNSKGYFLLAVIAASGLPRAEGGFPAQSQPLVDAAKMPDTLVMPHTEFDMPPNKTCVYCASFQLAWIELKESVIGSPVQLAGQPPMASVLNRRDAAAADVPAGSYFAMSGTVRNGVLARMRQAQQRLFPDATLTVPRPRRDTEIYAYAYLQRQLPFSERFRRLRSPLQFRHADHSTAVAAFGIDKFDPADVHDHRVGGQVTILDYESDDDFILRLNTVVNTEELVLAKVAPEETLESTIAVVKARIRKRQNDGHWIGHADLKKDERLAVPVLLLRLDRSYHELLDRDLLNPGWTGWYISEARQGIRFRFDEAGAVLESNGGVGLGFGGFPPDRELQPRHFIFDKPFLLYIRLRNARNPYFAVWIGNPDLMKQMRP